MIYQGELWQQPPHPNSLVESDQRGHQKTFVRRQRWISDNWPHTSNLLVEISMKLISFSIVSWGSDTTSQQRVYRAPKQTGWRLFRLNFLCPESLTRGPQQVTVSATFIHPGCKGILRATRVGPPHYMSNTAFGLVTFPIELRISWPPSTVNSFDRN